ncbi:unnamed protein product [Merluccius merluccius]
MTSYVWLTFYYYIMIVPSQRTLFLWVKKNIKSVIYVMLFVDSFATAHYLNKHMKSLAASGGSLFNPRLGSQIRVTVTGILQEVLSCLYALWT